MTSRQKGHRWQPIEDLSSELRARRFPELDGLIAVLDKRRGELEGASAVREFVARLVRSWSIETGILERLYTLSDGATLTLIEQGFDAALLSHGDTDLAPQQLVDILNDHQDAAEGLFAFVKGGRALTTSYVKELHQALTRHQQTCDAMDPNGNWVKVPLVRGDWKKLANNPGDVKTGEVWHQYCPPEQVASEMDRLIAMHAHHDDVHAVVEAAWLHHRFAQVHPFQDGNGRVARALASLICIRARGLPVVVPREQKEPYIRALEQADRGDLGPLIVMFERQQRESLLKAISASESVMTDVGAVDAILSEARRKLESADRRDSTLAALVADLSSETVRRFEAVKVRVASALPMVTVAVPAQERGVLTSSGEAAALADKQGYKATFAGLASEVTLNLQAKQAAAMLVVSFHQVGQVDDGVGGVLVLLRGAKTRGAAPPFYSAASEGPFTFTADRDAVEVRASFSAWLERAITRGLDLWQRAL